MDKTVRLTLTDESELEYYVEFGNEWVSFDDGPFIVSLPIEVFYQMWNSEEMISYMEDYHKRRLESENSSNNR